MGGDEALVITEFTPRAGDQPGTQARALRRDWIPPRRQAASRVESLFSVHDTRTRLSESDH